MKGVRVGLGLGLNKYFNFLIARSMRSIESGVMRSAAGGIMLSAAKE